MHKFLTEVTAEVPAFAPWLSVLESAATAPLGVEGERSWRNKGHCNLIGGVQHYYQRRSFAVVVPVGATRVRVEAGLKVAEGSDSTTPPTVVYAHLTSVKVRTSAGTWRECAATRSQGSHGWLTGHGLCEHRRPSTPEELAAQLRLATELAAAEPAHDLGPVAPAAGDPTPGLLVVNAEPVVATGKARAQYRRASVADLPDPERVELVVAVKAGLKVDRFLFTPGDWSVYRPVRWDGMTKSFQVCSPVKVRRALTTGDCRVIGELAPGLLASTVEVMLRRGEERR